MRKYKKIPGTDFKNGDFSLVPIRDEDKYEIMNWRNAQIEVLRQDEPLTPKQQEEYFRNVIDKLFEQVFPRQFLFSFLENGKLIGYGGLVHINWDKKTAEVSFLTETSRNASSDMFVNDWMVYLSLVKQIADECLNFNMIYTYAYDIRPALYLALESSGFRETERIKSKVNVNNKSLDVVIHSYFMDPLIMGLATEGDVDLYFKWVNDPEVRKRSFHQDPVNYELHVAWFKSKINDPNYKFYLFKNKEGMAIGQVRISKNTTEVVVGISVDSNFRGKGYGRKILRLACQNYFEITKIKSINAYVKDDNKSSMAIFLGCGFTPQEQLPINNVNATKLTICNEEY